MYILNRTILAYYGTEAINCSLSPIRATFLLQSHCHYTYIISNVLEDTMQNLKEIGKVWSDIWGV
jgi:hypothetical protein